MKSIYTKEHSTGYKVGGLQLIAEELFRVHIQFFAKKELRNNEVRVRFLRIFKHFPELSVKYSRFVIESHHVNY